MKDPEAEPDKFIAMVTAKVDVDLRLSDFHPRSMLKTVAHHPQQAKFAVIDYHNHLDAQDPQHLLKIMDSCGIERIVNITMRPGDDGIAMIEKFNGVAPERFSTIGWMDWRDLDTPHFFKRSVERLDRLVERGVCGFKLWKDLGTSVREANGHLLRIDDERLAPLFNRAGELGLPVMVHFADPAAFFTPIDCYNERYEELAAHPDWSFYAAEFSKEELLSQRDRVFTRHPETTFIAAHIAEAPENLAYVSALLDRCENVYVDIGARVAELGRQPYTAREFFLKYSDRILFGTDLVPEREMYRSHYRFLETADEYFEYPSHASRQGRWNICGLFLPDDVLQRVYRDNALKLLAMR